MKAQRSSNVGQIKPPNAELDALERLEKSPYTNNKIKDVATFSKLIWIGLFILPGNDDIYKSVDESKFCQI